MEVINWCINIYKDDLDIQDINVGINIGENSGASIPHHLHIHLIPREKRDIGFFQLLTGEAVIRGKSDDLIVKIREIFSRKIFKG